LGITGMDWEVDPKGINTGGWELMIRTEDMAKFGQLFLQKGMWNGKQILPAAWVEEASTVKIIQHPDMPQSKRDSSEWEQGYCYQMWRCRHNAYRGDGAFGQYIIVMPDKDAVVAITAETPDMQEEINLVWQYLLPAMHDDKLPTDKDNQTKLSKKLASLALPVPVANNAAFAANISGRGFQIEPNAGHVQNISFSFTNNSCIFQLATDTAVYRIHFAAGKWQEDETLMHGPSLVAGAKASFVGLPALKTNGAYTWKDEHTLELTLRYIESPHTEKITCHFDGDTVTIDMENSFDYGNRKTTLKGKM